MDLSLLNRIDQIIGNEGCTIEELKGLLAEAYVKIDLLHTKLTTERDQLWNFCADQQHAHLDNHQGDCYHLAQYIKTHFAGR